ncbi:SRPBCC family protein [Rhizobium skierniewicense]|uniref:SRPBCC family protein n=1 Tax=Rhizobium TaxID=379 RepID=UPI001FAB7CC3|nr:MULTISPECIES: SRPBCC family protein [Rhizobium]MCI9865592.1 SRPBCC family protein [Rhizobium skierniewicense]
MTVMPSRIIHLSIERPWKEVYAFASDPARMPQWAAGLATGLVQDGEEWIASGPLGDVRVKFAERNAFGVIDHSVTLPHGLQVYNALRVMPNGDGAEVAFTLMKLPGMSDADFERDAAMVFADLERLKALVEGE